MRVSLADCKQQKSRLWLLALLEDRRRDVYDKLCYTAFVLPQIKSVILPRQTDPGQPKAV